MTAVAVVMAFFVLLLQLIQYLASLMFRFKVTQYELEIHPWNDKLPCISLNISSGALHNHTHVALCTLLTVYLNLRIMTT